MNKWLRRKTKILKVNAFNNLLHFRRKIKLRKKCLKKIMKVQGVGSKRKNLRRKASNFWHQLPLTKEIKWGLKWSFPLAGLTVLKFLCYILPNLSQKKRNKPSSSSIGTQWKRWKMDNQERKDLSYPAYPISPHSSIMSPITRMPSSHLNINLIKTTSGTLWWTLHLVCVLRMEMVSA